MTGTNQPVPARRESVGGDAADRWARAPVEVHGFVDAGDAGAGEIRIVEIGHAQARRQKLARLKRFNRRQSLAETARAFSSRIETHATHFYQESNNQRTAI